MLELRSIGNSGEKKKRKVFRIGVRVHPNTQRTREFSALREL